MAVRLNFLKKSVSIFSDIVFEFEFGTHETF